MAGRRKTALARTLLSTPGMNAHTHTPAWIRRNLWVWLWILLLGGLSFAAVQGQWALPRDAGDYWLSSPR